MGVEGIEHRTEVRSSGGRAVTVGVVAALVGLVVALVVRAGSGDDAEPAVAPEPATTASPTSTTAPVPVVAAVADVRGGPVPASTGGVPADRPEPGTAFEELEATPVHTDGWIAVLVDGGTLLAGRPGGTFQHVPAEGPISAIAASSEPGHVWAITQPDVLRLVDLRTGPTTVEMPLEDERLLGPAAFGVVTVGADGGASWRRPSFDPPAAAVPLPPELVPVDAGGDHLLAEAPDDPVAGRRFEVWSVVSGTLVEAFVVPPSDRPAALATDGSAVALPHLRGWVVRDVATRELTGQLPTAPGEPAWTAGGRFAVVLDGRIAVSDGTEIDPPWVVRAVAEQASLAVGR